MSSNQPDALVDSQYLQTLRLIDTRLKDTGINWALTGSLAFALQGMPVTPHDIDIQTDQAGAYAIEQILSEFVIQPVAFSSTEKIRSYFGVLMIDGIRVEIMGDIQKQLDDGMWEEPVDLTRHKRLLYIEGISIPVLSLEYEYKAYLTMGRLEKARLIREALQKMDTANSVIIRTIRESDADMFLILCKKLDAETSFMMLEPGERTATVEEVRAHIAQVLSQRSSTILVAECDEQLAGYIEASGGEYRRNRHSAYLVIGILQAFAGQGIGTRLFIVLEEWARQQHLHRLELTVMAHNQAGIALYKKRGFEVEGEKRHAMLVDGNYIDEYYMAKLL